MKKELTLLQVDEVLELGIRPSNALNRYGIRTIGNLLKLSKCDLKRIPNFGKQSLLELMLELKKQNLELKSECLCAKLTHESLRKSWATPRGFIDFAKPVTYKTACEFMEAMANRNKGGGDNDSNA